MHFPSESEQKVRELEQIKIKLEEEIRKQEDKLKCEFRNYYENKCNTRHQRMYHQHSTEKISLAGRMPLSLSFICTAQCRLTRAPCDFPSHIINE